MKLPRRTFLQYAGAVAAAPAFSRVATAQPYPTRPITMILPFPAGGIIDAEGRLLAERMRKSLGQPIIIENVSGASGSIGVGRAARARPDGYTIVLGGLPTQVLNGAFYSLQYDVLNDFAPISLLATTPYVLFARKTTPAQDLIELIDWLKSNPNKASAGIVSTGSNLVTTFFQKETETQFTLVPYRGVAPALQDLVAGQFDLLLTTPDALPLMRAGSIKAYAVTSDTRLALAPEIPTFVEMRLPTISYSGWCSSDACNSGRDRIAASGQSRRFAHIVSAAAVPQRPDPAAEDGRFRVGPAASPFLAHRQSV
jgi:tripartite-type tricarboxylate transporter receptor subunit TctC